jgi:transcriptional regulator with XRE-family HTH domain
MSTLSTPEERIALRMRTARKRLRISQEEAAGRLGVVLRTYARWERGESLGFIGHLDEIAGALETSESELLGGENALSDGPTVQELSAKLDAIMDELRRLRRDLVG